jgi:hypothetical protein
MDLCGQRLANSFPREKNTRATVEELLGAVVSCTVSVISNTQYALKGKYAISYSWNNCLVLVEVWRWADPPSNSLNPNKRLK